MECDAFFFFSPEPTEAMLPSRSTCCVVVTLFIKVFCLVYLCRSLSYDKSKTVFRASPTSESPGEPVVHRIPLANQFQVPVVIYDVKLPSKAQDYFTVSELAPTTGVERE